MKIITPDLDDMTYDELCCYLLKKYGKAEYDYFSTPECKSVQKKNSRTKEGLEIHPPEDKTLIQSVMVEGKTIYSLHR